MQLQGFMLVLFLLAVVPIMAISANHEVFFVIMSLFLMIISIKNIHGMKSAGSSEEFEADDELEEEEVEELLGLNVKRFGTGISIVKNLFIMLFLIYCSFYLNSVVFKACSVIAILLQLFFLRQTLREQDMEKEKTEGNMQRAENGQNRYLLQFMSSDILNITIIIFTVLNKITGSKF